MGSGLGPPLLPNTFKPLGRERRTLRQLLLSSMEAPDLQVVAHIYPEQRPLPLYPHCAMSSTRAGLSLSLGPGLQKGCLGSQRVDIQGLPHNLPTCSSLTCVQGLWHPERREPGVRWPAIYHMHTTLLSFLCCQPLLQGLDKKLLLLHTNQASLQGKDEMVQISRAQQTR